MSPSDCGFGPDSSCRQCICTLTSLHPKQLCPPQVETGCQGPRGLLKRVRHTEQQGKRRSMYRVTASIPRLLPAAVCISAVVLQRRVRKNVEPLQQPVDTSSVHGRSCQHVAQTRATTTHMAATAPRFGLMVGSSLSTALVRTLCQVLQNMWLSAAIGAAATWATVNGKVVTTIRQLQMASHQKPAVEQVLDVGTVRQFCGQWTKVAPRSDSMDKFCELFGVPKWLRQATRLMSGMHISVAGGTLIVKQVCKLSWLSAVETFPLDGSCSKPQKRRDMRGGKQTGQLLAAQDGSMTVSVCWQGAWPGTAVDTLQLQETKQGTELVVFHKAQVEGRGTAEFKEVFSCVKS